MSWQALLFGAFLAAWFLRITLWIDPGWKDARSEVPLLDRIVSPFSRFGEPIGQGLAVLEFLWYGFYTVTVIACAVLALR